MGPSSSVTLATASTGLTSRINGMTTHCTTPIGLALSVSFCLFYLFFVSWETSLFPSMFVPLPFPISMDITLYVCLSDDVFLTCDHELDN